MADVNRRARRAAGGASARQLTAREARYGQSVNRNALAPGLLGAIGLFVGLALISTTSFVIVEYAVAILALIVAWFAYQAKHWWWIPPLVAIAVLWNPIWPFPFAGEAWIVAQIAGAAVFTAAAFTVRKIERD